MCGIAGFVSTSVDPEARRGAVERMCAAMVHRGPDDSGLVTQGPATLGMRRLAIFDPAHGHQPMQSADGRFHLVFNGAIYNFRELREELKSAGQSFHTDCDTEVLLAAFAVWGADCLLRLRGMFAFAIWDARNSSLLLARDAFGIKPLYFSQLGGGLVFASEIRALLQSQHVSGQADLRAVSDSLAYLAVPAPRTFYRDVRSLRPGDYAVWRNGELAIKTYWGFDYAARTSHSPCATRAEFVHELRQRLGDSIRAHCLADVPVGAFLSGGLDSNAVVGLMARQAGSQLKTFSIGFHEDAYSEAAPAAAAAKHFGTEHQTFVLTGERVARDIDAILDTLDQPTGDAINTYYVSQVAKAGGVTVALSGLGGDELFGGYSWFRSTPRIAQLLPCWRILPVGTRELLLKPWRRGDSKRQKLADLLTHATDLHSLAALQRRNFSETARTSLLAEAPPFEMHSQLGALRSQLGNTTPFSVVSAWELRTYMADVLLRDSDVMSMRHSLELRVPLVDRPLIDWLWRQPDAFKISAGRNKPALADAVADILPPGVANRPKQGFTLPFALWMRGPLRAFLDETYSTQSVSRSGFFNTPAVQSRWKTYLAGNDPREWSRIWSLAILIAFLNRRALTR